MARSRTHKPQAHSHSTHHASANHHNPRKPARTASWIVAIFLALVGIAVGFFAGGDALSTIVGGIVGGVAGYLAGLSIDKNSLAKSK